MMDIQQKRVDDMDEPLCPNCNHPISDHVRDNYLGEKYLLKEFYNCIATSKVKKKTYECPCTIFIDSKIAIENDFEKIWIEQIEKEKEELEKEEASK